ncbi:hypothetical protein Tco_0523617 [Tanacetum coccineum]
MPSSKKIICFTTIALLPLCFAFAAVDEDLSPLAAKVTAAVNYSAIEVNGNIGQTKVKRYRPGKAPEWADNHVGDHEDKNDNLPMSGSVVLEKGYDRRLSRLAENRLYDDV